jgi:cytochrome c-type biogenesis protein CcmE
MALAMGSLRALRTGSLATVVLVFGFLSFLLLLILVIVDFVLATRAFPSALWIVTGLALLMVLSATRPAAFSYYVTPSQALADARLQGRNVRVAGAIIPGSVSRSEGQIAFVVSDGSSTLDVAYAGALPYTFREAWRTEGWEAVVEGKLGPARTLQATNVLVRHLPEMQVRRRGQEATRAGR